MVGLAAQITDRGQQLFTLTGLLIFTDKIIDQEIAGRVRRMIEMTQEAQIFEEEKQQALLQAKQDFAKEKQKALDQAAKKFEKELQKQEKKYKKKEQQEKRKLEEEKQKELEQVETQTVRKMLQRGYPSEEIASLVSGYSEEAVEQLRAEMQRESLPQEEPLS